MDKKNGDKKLTWEDIGYNQFHEKNKFLEGTDITGDYRKRKLFELEKKNLELQNQQLTNTKNTSSQKPKIDIKIVFAKLFINGKRTSIPIKIANLLVSGEAIKDWKVAKCFKPTMTREGYDPTLYHELVESRIKYLRRIVKNKGYEIRRTKDPQGYKLVFIGK